VSGQRGEGCKGWWKTGKEWKKILLRIAVSMIMAESWK